MRFITIVVAVASLLTNGNSVHAFEGKGGQKNLRRRTESSLLCLILEVHMQTSSGEKQHLECDLISEDEGAMVNGLQIELPHLLVENRKEELRRGEWYVRIFGAKVNETSIDEYGPLRTSVWVPKHANIITISPKEGNGYMQAIQGSLSDRYLVGDQRRASKSVRRILVARVSTSDRSPTYSKEQLQQYFFSLNSYSVVRQYSLCSSGWLWFKGYSNQISVVDVYVPGSVGSFNERSLLGAALTQLQSQLNVRSITSITEHVAFIFPSGLQGGTWYGYGVVSSYRVVMNDKYGGIPNTVMHELGHNLGLNHAGMGSDQYDDVTDVMGYGDFSQFGPSRCFNGLHIWQLGWFRDRSLTANPYTHTIIQMACFADYSKTQPGQYVVVKVGSFYLVFNAAVGVNSGTEAVPNQITIVEPGATYTQRVGAISNTTSPFQVGSYGGGAGTLIIKVCKYFTTNGIQLAVVSIGINNANCS